VENWKELPKIVIAFLFLFTSNILFAKSVSEEVYNKLQHQIEIKNFLGAKNLAERIFKKTTDAKTGEITFILYWEASGYLHYKRGEFNKILEDIGGLNLYWSIFKDRRYYEDVYFETLGKLYTLLFQYRRAVIFFIQSYRLKPSQHKLLEIIYATEMAYYNEIRPYLDYSFVKMLLNRVKKDKLNIFERALYQFEVGLYNLLVGKCKIAYKNFRESFDLDKSFLTEGQADFFMGKALECSGDLKRAYFYYKKALTLVKHPLYKKNILYRLFIVSAKLKFYREANSYYLGLAQFGGIENNPYLQEATLLIPSLGDFKKHFYWKKSYDLLVSKIMWLNINNERGKRAFLYFLKRFLQNGKLHSEFLTAWKVLYPHEVKGLKVSPSGILRFELEQLENLKTLWLTNKELFKHFFGDYGYLALGKYFFLKGNWNKAKKFLSGTRLKTPYKFFVEGVIEAYKGNPHFLEAIYPSLEKKYKVSSLFWLGWGYLIRGRWDLTSLYWEEFLHESVSFSNLFWEKLFASYYLALHYEKLKLTDKAVYYYSYCWDLAKRVDNFKGLKRFISLKLALLKGDKNPSWEFLKLLDKDWQKFLKYLLMRGGN